ncbi:MAG: threonine-phosphate decarboxylase, partial [Pseudomonadota bacterium]
MEERHLLLTGSTQDHGGGIDAARTLYGGSRIAWVDLSTGINPCAYPVAGLRGDVWSALPDSNALAALLAAARRHWKVPEGADVLAAPGASAIIARVPTLAPPGQVIIPQPTYNEHAAAFAQSGWRVRPDGQGDAQVVVHPNNPDGRLWTSESLSHEAHALTVIDE